MKKTTKYIYLKVLQGNYGYGWADLESAEINKPDQVKELRRDLQAYRENQPAAYRIIRRRELNNKQVKA